MKSPKGKKKAMTAADLNILERMFEHEINRALSDCHPGLPYQSKSKRMDALAAAGYIEPAQVTIGIRYPVTVTGWELTHLGRLTYCATCKDGGSEMSRYENEPLSDDPHRTIPPIFPVADPKTCRHLWANTGLGKAWCVHCGAKPACLSKGTTEGYSPDGT